MAYNSVLSLFVIISVFSRVNAITCPGFPGYCSESFVGQTCVVVCSAGRPNVPLCQDDGTWTDIPRCIEHEPGKEEQIPGLCPGITGYCSEGFLHQRCNFRCDTGKLIDSKCTQDGTWEPYPTCPGDLRETKDGCDPCPGPFGGPRNRTIEAHSAPKAQIAQRVKNQQAALENRFLGINGGGRKQTRPSNTIDTGNRVVRPTFAGSQAFGVLSSSSSNIPNRSPNIPNRSSNIPNRSSNIPNRSNVQSFIPPQNQRQKIPQAPTPPAPMPQRPVTSFRQETSRPSSRPQQPQVPQSNTNVIEPSRTSPFLSVGPDGRIRAESDPNLSNTRGSGPAPNFQQQSMRQNQFTNSFSRKGAQSQNMFGQSQRGRRPQTGFTPEQRKIIQDALSKLPSNVRNQQTSNFFNQQTMNQPQSQSQFGRFPQRQSQMSSTNPRRRLNFNPLSSQGNQLQQGASQSSSRARPQTQPRPQPPTPPPRQPSRTQSGPSIPRSQPANQVVRQPPPQVQATQPPRPTTPKKKLSALQQILALQSKKGPTGAKNGGTPPPPTERPKPQRVMLFQEDNAAVPRTITGSEAFGVFEAVNLNSPSKTVQQTPGLQAFPAVPTSARGARAQRAQTATDNSQFGVFETVQL